MIRLVTGKQYLPPLGQLYNGGNGTVHTDIKLLQFADRMKGIDVYLNNTSSSFIYISLSLFRLELLASKERILSKHALKQEFKKFIHMLIY